MRAVPLAALLALGVLPAAAQVRHPGEVERWFLALAPMQQARACLPDGDPLRPGLEALLRDTREQAMRSIDNDYERGLLTGRLMENAQAVRPQEPDDAACRVIMAEVARGLLRLHLP